MIYLNISRMFKYVSLSNISKDEERQDHSIYTLLTDGISVADMKNWFAKRCLFFNTPEALSENNKVNLELAKKCFSLLNAEYKFSRVDAKNLMFSYLLQMEKFGMNICHQDLNHV